jgi:hypothetical protein
VGALSDPVVGEYFANNFVAAHEQVGDFEVLNVNGNLQKNGGNVASYFCTPDGRVVHTVLGPVTPDELLKQAKWAVENYNLAAEHEDVYRQKQVLAKAHVDALSKPGLVQSPHLAGRLTSDKAHVFLAHQGFPRLEAIYRMVFEDLLGERVSDTRGLQMAEAKLRAAKENSRPVLFVLNRSSFGIGNSLSRSVTQGTARALLSRYVVISISPRELPALSRLTKQPPYEVGSQNATMFVVCRSNGEQLGATSGRTPSDLPKLLAQGLVDNAMLNPPLAKEIRTLIRLVKRYDDAYGDELRQLYQRSISPQRSGEAETDDELLSRALLEE